MEYARLNDCALSWVNGGKMESRNYTYERITHVKSGESLKYGKAEVIYKTWGIINLSGVMIAEASSEKQAELIVAALNGVSP